MVFVVIIDAPIIAVVVIMLLKKGLACVIT